MWIDAKEMVGEVVEQQRTREIQRLIRERPAAP
jgi:hypothetical protein